MQSVSQTITHNHFAIKVQGTCKQMRYGDPLEGGMIVQRLTAELPFARRSIFRVGFNHSAFSWWTQHEGCSSVQMEVQRSNAGQSFLLREEERPQLESGFWQRSKSRRPNCSGFFSSELALKQILDLDGIAVSVANPWTSKEVCVALNAGSMPITTAPLSATPATYLITGPAHNVRTIHRHHLHIQPNNRAAYDSCKSIAMASVERRKKLQLTFKSTRYRSPPSKKRNWRAKARRLTRGLATTSSDKIAPTTNLVEVWLSSSMKASNLE